MAPCHYSPPCQKNNLISENIEDAFYWLQASIDSRLTAKKIKTVIEKILKLIEYIEALILDLNLLTGTIVLQHPEARVYTELSTQALESHNIVVQMH